MSNEIISLEEAQPIGVFGAIGEGLELLYANIGTVLEIGLPVLMSCFGLLICLLPALVESDSIALVIVSLITGLWVFIHWFWQMLLGIVAVSYFAKDVYEDKPRQDARTYYGYVEEHTKSYIKYWLWMCLLTSVVVGAILYLVIMRLSNHVADFRYNGLEQLGIIPPICIVICILLYVITSISPLFWAYNDKSKPGIAIIKTIKVCLNPIKIFKIIVLLAILNIIFSLATILPGFLSTGIVTTLTSGTDSLITKFFVALIIGQIFSGYIMYCNLFVFTRYYFELAKK